MNEEILPTQALVVTTGPFTGRICQNDDNDVIDEEDFDDPHLQWILDHDVTWRQVKLEPDEDTGEGPTSVIDCEIVTFGDYFHCRGYSMIPRQFLRPANMRDLVSRAQMIDQRLGGFSLLGKGYEDYKDAYEDTVEYLYVVEQIAYREKMEDIGSITLKSLFLCHSSADKHFVRQVRNDLARAGHSTWMDEFEIKVGESIVDKINSATETADGLVLFISTASNRSEWVKKEWQSVLMRSLKLGSPKILPALIEECDPPALIADLRYADFSSSYNKGLSNLLSSIA